MKKGKKLIFGSLALLLGGLTLSGCTKSFCTVDDQAHMLYAYDYGITEYRSSDENVGEKLFENNDNIFVTYLDINNLPEGSGLLAAETAAKNSGTPTPSLDFWKELDNLVLNRALASAGIFDTSTSSLSYDQLIGALDSYGYLKFSGETLFENFDNDCNDAALNLLNSGIDDKPTKDYLNSYKSSLSALITNKRSCFAIKDGYYGYYGYKSDTGFRDSPDTVFLSKKTWKSAWKQGFFQGLLVYPIGWLTETFVGLFSGHDDAKLAKGFPQLLALLTVTFIIRGLMLLVTFKQTAASGKMQALQPEIAKIQAKYPNANTNNNEKQRMAMDMQKLYKKNGINPFSSIVTLIVQFPVFICVWGALQGSASLATGSFLGLNLSESISSFLFHGDAWRNGSAVTALILFLLMAGTQVVSMLLPQWIQKAADKKVAKLGKNPAKKEQDNKMKWFTYIMMAMIIVMGFTLASAMGVYWLVGALFSIFQTLILQKINKNKKAK